MWTVEQQLSLIEKAIMSSYDICLSLDASKNDPNIDLQVGIIHISHFLVLNFTIMNTDLIIRSHENIAYI
jgi:hypothetical protein